MGGEVWRAQGEAEGGGEVRRAETGKPKAGGEVRRAERLDLTPSIPLSASGEGEAEVWG